MSINAIKDAIIFSDQVPLTLEALIKAGVRDRSTHQIEQ